MWDPLTRTLLALTSAICVALFIALPAAGANRASSLSRPVPKILSASWGTDGAVGCPNGEQGLDNIPVTFNWFIRRTSIQPSDFRIVRSDRSVATPACALQFPPNESDEAQTVNLIGDFGDSVNGPTPVAIRVTGALQGKPPGAHEWQMLQRLPKVSVAPLSGGPYIVDAWTLMPSIYLGDPNRCMVGKTFVRVMWSNGLTAYPTGEESRRPGSRLLPRPLRAAKRPGTRDCTTRSRRPPRPRNLVQRRQHARPLPPATPARREAHRGNHRREPDPRPQR